MTDQIVPQHPIAQPTWQKRLRQRLERQQFEARGTAGALMVIATGAASHILQHEGSAPSMVFVACASLLAMAVITMITRRVLVAAVLTVAMMAIVVIASAEKVRLMHMAIHAYDIVYYLSSPATLKFLFLNFPAPMIQLFGAFAMLGFAAWATSVIDPTRVARSHAAAAVAVLMALTGWSASVKGSRADMQNFEQDLALSTFYASWSETAETLWRGQLFEASPSAGGAPFVIPASCDLPRKPPNVILIHQESVVPPEYFPKLGYDKKLDPMFRSDDKKLHPLRVETYAGASWLTEFSILAGVSTYSFGGMRPFVQALMAGKVHDTLPEALGRCGYRNTVFYPLSKNFVSNGRFYSAVGMPEIFDMKDQGSKTGYERDRFFYNNMLSMMDTHFATSAKPLFTFLITFATHQPYYNTFMPEVKVAGGAPGTPSEMNEFLRRLGMAHMDYDWMKAELARRFPNERFLIVHYGDHQPTSTWPLLSEADRNAIRSKDRTITKDSAAYLTYYAMEGINYTVPPMPDVATLDVPYVGTALLEAAGLPLSPAYQERKRLMQVCNGRYNGCEKPNEILSFHRRLIDSGLMDAR
jgi:phosphoglycerol transferase MdoB-like AlkP superfamily enzyme